MNTSPHSGYVAWIALVLLLATLGVEDVVRDLSHVGLRRGKSCFIQLASFGG